ncbi:MAG: hypothetical protein PHS63_04025, partial [Desulfoplanes sp.]|nr:hypothetical protein [Desulfoplanes sp.]
EKIASLLAQRTRLLAKAAGTRRRKKVSLIDDVQEKNIWHIWEQAFETEGLNKATLKKFFLLLNSLAYAHVEKKNDDAGSMCMYPRRQPVEIDIQGPRDTLQTRIAIALSTECPSSFEMHHFQTSEMNVELIKAFNQAGAAMSWERKVFKNQANATIELDNKVIFCGSDVFNLYLLLCRSLTKPGQIKFSGTSATKFLDLRPLQKLLPLLGARLTTIDPHSNGLPARLECSGHAPEEIEIPWGIDTLFILALAVNAPLFSKGLRMVLQDEKLAHKIFMIIRPIFEQFTLPIAQKDNVITIPSKAPVCSGGNIEIPIDLSMGAYMLTLPFFRGGQAKLQGHWPEIAQKGSFFESLLSEFGISMEVSKDCVETRCEGNTDGVYVDITDKSTMLPLVTALCLGTSHNATIRFDQFTADVEHAENFLTFLNIDHSIKKDRIDIRPKNSNLNPPDGSWDSPTPFWTLSYVMASFVLPGICLSNPGELTSIWPDFWNIFNNLPAPQKVLRSQPKSPTMNKVNDEQPKPKRRRIKTN